MASTNVKARRVLRQIAVEIPANPNVTKLDGSCEATTHIYNFTTCCSSRIGSLPENIFCC
jgi:hypothetical protein